MKNRSTSSLGALHPVLFFAGVYFVVLVFSIFICSSIFYSCNTAPAKEFSSKEKKASETDSRTMAFVATH